MGLPDCHTFIVGTRSEAFEQVRDTLGFVEALDPFAAIFMLWTDDRESLSPALAAQAQERRERIGEMLRARWRPERPWIVPALGLHYDPALLRRLRRRRGGPLWRHLRG